MKINTHFKLLFSPFWPILKLMRSISSSHRPRVTVLLFHDIPQRNRQQFERIITFIHRNYQFIGPEDFEKFLQGEYIPRKHSFLVTFDDGFKSSFEATRLFLDPLQVKAIFFVCSRYIDVDTEQAKEFLARKILNDPNQISSLKEHQMPMSVDDLKELIKNGHYVGGHTSNHKRLSSITSGEEFEDEIFHSATCLQEMLGKTVSHFAYPFGDIGSVNAEAYSFIKKRYLYCFSGVRGSNDPRVLPMAIRREAINLNDSGWFNRFVILGGLSWAYGKKRKLLDSLAT